MKNIRAKRALVTGAASGIGRAIAVALAREGADVDLVDIDAEPLTATANAVRGLNVEARELVCDLQQPAQIDRLLIPYIAGLRPLDILVNNAGVVYHGPTETMSAAAWDRLLQINLLAPIAITRKLLPALLARQESHIVNVSSIFGLVATDQTAAYHVSKFGLVGFSESLRSEYANRGLGVTALCPGFTKTSLYASAETGYDGPIVQPPNWLLTSPAVVADRAIRAIYRNRGTVVVSPLARLLWYGKRFAPGLIGAVWRAVRGKGET